MKVDWSEHKSDLFKKQQLLIQVFIILISVKYIAYLVVEILFEFLSENFITAN